MRKPSVKDHAKLDRLRAREERLLERGQAAESRARDLYAQAAEVGRDVVELELKLGIRKSSPIPLDLTKATAIFKKVYARAA